MSAELFDPTTDTFTELTGSGRSLTESREGAAAAKLPSGRILIAGGDRGGGGPIRSSAEIFDPATDTFTRLTGGDQSLTEARYAPIAATLPSGQVLIAGGAGNPESEGTESSAELFDPATDTFKELSGIGQSMAERRLGAVAATLPSGQVLIAGGLTGEGGECCNTFLSSAEVFDPGSDTFGKLTQSGGSMVEPREGAVAAALHSGQVLIAGGFFENAETGQRRILASAELFSPTVEGHRNVHPRRHRRGRPPARHPPHR